METWAGIAAKLKTIPRVSNVLCDPVMAELEISETFDPSYSGQTICCFNLFWNNTIFTVYVVAKYDIVVATVEFTDAKDNIHCKTVLLYLPEQVVKSFTEINLIQWANKLQEGV